MDVKGINAGIVAPKKVSKEQQEAIQRVQIEFLNQIAQGKEETEAFKNSLKAIDEKYNPEEDKVVFSDTANQPQALGKMAFKKPNVKMPSIESIVTWLTVITEVLPKILEIINIIPKPNVPNQPVNPENGVA